MFHLTFDTFEHQLSSLKTPRYGHLLQTPEKQKPCTNMLVREQKHAFENNE